MSGARLAKASAARKLLGPPVAACKRMWLVCAAATLPPVLAFMP